MSLKIQHQSSETEKHSSNVAVILNLGDQIITGADDGKFKIWTPDLKQISEVDTGCGAFLSITAGSDAIFSCTSDQTLQAWDLKTLKGQGPLESTSLLNPQKVFFEPVNNTLWVGDSQGHVAKYVDRQQSGTFELTEEIWDLYVTANPTLIFTARDRDVLVSEIVTGQLRSNAVVKATVEGRYPLLITKDTMCCLDREGRQIQVRDKSVATNFKLLRAIPAGKMILNAICSGSGNSVFTGGYDGEVSQWDISTGQSLGSVEVGSCINALAPADNGAYVAVADGRVLRVGP